MDLEVVDSTTDDSVALRSSSGLSIGDEPDDEDLSVHVRCGPGCTSSVHREVLLAPSHSPSPPHPFNNGLPLFPEIEYSQVLQRIRDHLDWSASAPSPVEEGPSFPATVPLKEIPSGSEEEDSDDDTSSFSFSTSDSSSSSTSDDGDSAQAVEPSALAEGSIDVAVVVVAAAPAEMHFVVGSNREHAASEASEAVKEELTKEASTNALRSETTLEGTVAYNDVLVETSEAQSLHVAIGETRIDLREAMCSIPTIDWGSGLEIREEEVLSELYGELLVSRSATAKMISMEETLASALSERDKLKNTVDECDRLKKRLEEQLSAAESKLESITRKETCTAVREMEKSLQEKNELNQQYRNDITSIKQQQEENEKRMQSLQQRAKEEQEQHIGAMSNFNKTIELLERANREATSKVQAKSDYVTELENKKSDTETRILQMEDEVTALQFKIETILLNLINSYQTDSTPPRNNQKNVMCTS